MARTAHDGGDIRNIVSDSARTFDNPSFLNKTISDAMYARMSGTQPQGAAVEWMGRSVLEMAAATIQARGGSVSWRSRSALADSVMNAAYHTTSDFSELLLGTGNRILQEAYAAAESPLKQISRERVSNDFRPVTTLRLGEAPTLLEVNEHGEVQAGTMAEAKESFRVRTFARMFNLSRNAIINDDTQAFADLAVAFGQAAAEAEATEMLTLLTANSGFGVTCDDTKAFFHVDHANLGATGAALDIDTLSEARMAMRVQKGLSGNPINVQPRYLLVGPEIESDAEKVLSSIYAATTADANIFSGKLQLLVEPRLEGGAWYVFSQPSQLAAFQHSYLANSRGPQISQEAGWSVLGMSYRAILDFGCGPGDFRAGYLNTGV